MESIRDAAKASLVNDLELSRRYLTLRDIAKIIKESIKEDLPFLIKELERN